MLSIDMYQPPAIIDEQQALSAALDNTLPSKKLDKNLIIATWNLRAFGGLTDQWTAKEDDSPKRDLRGLLIIANIISRFDVIAIQEVTGNLRALRHLLKLLGPNWSFLMTDITRGKAGNNERMAFVFDQRRVKLSGLASEIVIPPEWNAEISERAFQQQFARSPYAVSFQSQKTTFILVTAHIKYGDNPNGRVQELGNIAKWMSNWSTQINRWHHNLIVLGDFNIDRKGDVLWEAFTATGLAVPEELHNVRRSIFTSAGESSLDKYYDQIAWFESHSGATKLSIELLSAGSFDFLPYAYRDTELGRREISYRVSDHYPLWVEFKLP